MIGFIIIYNYLKMVEKDISNEKIKDQLYSRQIASMGIESMKKITELKILIIGMRGFGVEICKNIILQGPKKISIFDNSIVEYNDLCTNYYSSKENIGNKRRDESVLNKLRELNNYVFIECLSNYNSIGELENDIDKYNVVVITEIINKKYLLKINEICHAKNIKFIFSVITGLTGFIFSDFGEEHFILNKNDKEPMIFSIKNISNDIKGLIELVEVNEGINNVKSVIFENIEGMEELNNKEPMKIEIRDKYSFYIGDTSKFNKYIKGGIVKEKDFPIKIGYKDIAERLNQPYDKNGMILSFISDDDEEKISSEFLFLILREIINYYEKSGKNSLLYMCNNIDNYQIIIDNIKDTYTKNKDISWVKMINNIDENIIKNICLNINKDTPCLTSFIGGIVAQEIIKSIGKYFPINQWAIFDFSENYNNIYKNSNDINSRYKNLYDIFGPEIITNLQNKKLLLIGTGALGCELLKQFSLLGIKNVFAVDDDFIELSNLNRQFLFKDNDLGKLKVNIACNKALTFNPELNQYKSIPLKFERKTENIFNEQFLKNIDVIFCALDSLEGRMYIDERCILFEKPWINGGMNGCKGKTEIFIPFKTCCLKDINYESKKKVDSNSCTLRYFPTKIEDCILWAKNLFIKYFIDYIFDLEKIVNNKDEIEKIKNLDDNDENELLKLQIVYEYLNIYHSKDITNLIKLANNIFFFNFQKEIQKIVELYPNDYKNEDGSLFWKNKRIPQPLNISNVNNLYNHFLFNYVKILGTILNINVNNIDFQISDLSYMNYSLYYEKGFIYNEIIKIRNQINKFEINKIQFEKDSFSNGHIDFIHYCANLRAKNYNIPLADKYKTFKIAGNVAPSTITINAILSGLMSLELINFVYHENNIKKYTIDLDTKSGNYIEEIQSGLYFKQNYYDKIFECNFVVVPNKFSSWDKIHIKGSKTLSQLLAYLKDKYNIDVTLLNGNGTILFEKKILRDCDIILKKKKIIDDCLNMNIEQIYKQKNQDNKNENTIFINVSGNKDDSRVLMPILKYTY